MIGRNLFVDHRDVNDESIKGARREIEVVNRFGSFFYGSIAGVTSWSQNYALKGFLVFLLLLAILMFRSHGHPEKLLEN